MSISSGYVFASLRKKQALQYFMLPPPPPTVFAFKMTDFVVISRNLLNICADFIYFDNWDSTFTIL